MKCTCNFKFHFNKLLSDPTSGLSHLLIIHSCQKLAFTAGRGGENLSSKVVRQLPACGLCRAFYLPNPISTIITCLCNNIGDTEMQLRKGGPFSLTGTQTI